MAIQMIHKVTNKCWVILIILTAIVLLFLVFSLPEKEKIMPQEVTLELGKAGPQTFQKVQAVMDNHTANGIVGFLDLAWKPSKLGKVTIKHGRYSLTIPHTFTAMGTVWPEFKNEGVANIVLNSGISADEFIRHREAYEQWVKFMKQIQNSGWQPFIGLSEPRLSGKDALRYFQDKENSGLGYAIDPYVVPNFQTWLMAVNSGFGIFAIFYLDGIEMNISLDRTIRDQNGFDRDNIPLDFKEWGQYMMRIEFTTTRYNIRNDIYNQFIPDTIDDMAEREEMMNKINADLFGYLKRYQHVRLAKRQLKEEKLIKLGYHIDTSYQDFDSLPYLQKEPKF